MLYALPDLRTFSGSHGKAMSIEWEGNVKQNRGE